MRTTTDIFMDLAECKRQRAEIDIRERELYCELAGVSVQPYEVVAKPPQRVSPDQQPNQPAPRFKLARFMKGKFALIIWAVCRLKAFVRTDGEDVYMRDVANEIGACLGIHFTEEEWRSTLAGNFNVNEPRTFLWKMEEEIRQRYLGRKKADNETEASKNVKV